MAFIGVAIILGLAVSCFWGVCGVYRRRRLAAHRFSGPPGNGGSGENPAALYLLRRIQAPSQGASLVRHCTQVAALLWQGAGELAGSKRYVCCCSAGDIPEVQLVPQDVKMTVQPIVVIQVRP